MLQIIKNIKNSFLIIFTLFIFNHISAKEITNLSWKKSPVWKDLWKVRNVKPSLKWGLLFGNIHAGLNMWLNDLGLGFKI